MLKQFKLKLQKITGIQKPTGKVRKKRLFFHFFLFSDRDNRFPHRSQIQFDAKESDPTSDALDQLSAEMDRVLQRRYTVCFYKKLIHFCDLKFSKNPKSF